MTFPTHGDGPFFSEVNAAHARCLIERVTVLTSHMFIVFSVWKNRWSDAFDTLWIPAFYAMAIFEYSMFSVALSFHKMKLNLNPFQISLYEVVTVWSAFASALLLSKTIDDVVKQPGSGEYVERLVVTAITVVTSLWRLSDVVQSELTDISKHHSAQTETPVHVSSGGSLVAFPGITNHWTAERSTSDSRDVGCRWRCKNHSGDQDCVVCKLVGAGFSQEDACAKAGSACNELCDRHAEAVLQTAM